jgi:3D (Asp-Asp-Asp) domain-containing protein
MITSTAGLYAVNKSNTKIITSESSYVQNCEPVKANIVETNEDKELTQKRPVIEEPQTEIPVEIPKNERNMIVTAYTLSKSECGKNPWDRGYGITRGGEDLRNKDWQSARAIAIDPSIVPLHSTVELEFYDENYQKYSGEYLVCDTGSAIKGNKIDLFYSENDRKGALQFGVTECKMTVIEYGNN